MEKIFLRLREMIVEFPDGSVFGLGRLEVVKKGWVVKIKGKGDYEGERGMLKAIQLASQTTQAVAGYRDEDVELWDVVQIFDNEDDATEAGYENEQLSIYEIETGKLKWLD